MKQLLRAWAGIGLVARISMVERSSGSTAAASFFGFMAMAVRRVCILMFSRPLRMALPGPW
ncbi:hypothetical protein DKT77_13355, partial [Meridianimarinicoccus roseus]